MPGQNARWRHPTVGPGGLILREYIRRQHCPDRPQAPAAFLFLLRRRRSVRDWVSRATTVPAGNGCRVIAGALLEWRDTRRRPRPIFLAFRTIRPGVDGRKENPVPWLRVVGQH